MTPKPNPRQRARASRSSIPLQVREFPPELPGTAWLKLADVLQYVPVSRSQWFRGVASGQFPAPHKVGRLAFWKARDIRVLLDMGPKRARRIARPPVHHAHAA
jgi:prophage regulatory protein